MRYSGAFVRLGDQGRVRAGNVLRSVHAFVRGWLDEPYNRMQWAGEEYLFEEIQDAVDDSLVRLPESQKDSEDVAHWMGYLCRF